MDKLQYIYYQPNHLWKGWKAIKKLTELRKEKPKVVKQWLARQAFWQVHLLPPKCVERPHYEVTIPNEMHQFDFASRYKVARPLRTKQAKDVAEMIADIYKVGPLTFPKCFSVIMVASLKQI